MLTLFDWKCFQINASGKREPAVLAPAEVHSCNFGIYRATFWGKIVLKRERCWLCIPHVLEPAPHPSPTVWGGSGYMELKEVLHLSLLLLSLNDLFVLELRATSKTWDALALVRGNITHTLHLISSVIFSIVELVIIRLGGTVVCSVAS